MLTRTFIKKKSAFKGIHSKKFFACYWIKMLCFLIEITALMKFMIRVCNYRNIKILLSYNCTIYLQYTAYFGDFSWPWNLFLHINRCSNLMIEIQFMVNNWRSYIKSSTFKGILEKKNCSIFQEFNMQRIFPRHLSIWHTKKLT